MKLRKILKQLVAANIAVQKQNRHRRDTVSDKLWLNEQCTVKLGTGRQAGHTTSGVYLGEFYDVLFISPSAHMLSNLKKLADVSHLTTWWADNLIYDKIRGSQYDVVVVDTISVLTSKQLEDIKNGCATICKNKEFVLVLLQ